MFSRQHSSAGAQRLFISEITANAVYRASWQPSSLIAFAATVFECQPHLHGVIRWRPSSLGDLARQLQQIGTDFISALRIRVRELHENGVPLSAHLFLIIALPKQRVTNGAVEKAELWAFALGKPLSDIGEALGLWQIEDGAAGYLLGSSVKADSLQNIPIDILNPAFELTRDGAAALNGSVPSAMKVSAIGMGALGSQVIRPLTDELNEVIDSRREYFQHRDENEKNSLPRSHDGVVTRLRRILERVRKLRNAA